MMLWGVVLAAVGLAGIVATVFLMRRHVRKLNELKQQLR